MSNIYIDKRQETFFFVCDANRNICDRKKECRRQILNVNMHTRMCGCFHCTNKTRDMGMFVRNVLEPFPVDILISCQFLISFRYDRL